jgi:hypothetical protein
MGLYEMSEEKIILDKERMKTLVEEISLMGDVKLAEKVLAGLEMLKLRSDLIEHLEKIK